MHVCSVAQSCPTLCDPMDCSLPGSSVPGIFQARILEWIDIEIKKKMLLLTLIRKSIFKEPLAVDSLTAAPLARQGN